MKAIELNDEIFDQVFDELRNEYGSSPLILKTFDFAIKIWTKYHIPYKKDADIIREKMRAWWKNKPWKHEPRPHKMIGSTAVYLSAPMNNDYCCLQRGINNLCLSMIIGYQNQKQFTSLTNKEVKE